MKPQGVPTCGDESGDDSLLEAVRRYIKVTYDKPGNVYVGLIHRLDRPTGGVMVFAKTSKAASRLAAQMRGGDFEKKYLTVLVGAPQRAAGDPRQLSEKEPRQQHGLPLPADDGRRQDGLARLRACWRRRGAVRWCACSLHTGRTHQIRVQMAGIGCPVYGDMRYGGENAKKGGLALWAYSLAFTHPVTHERLRFMIEPPAEASPWKHFDLKKAMEL